jgi:alkylation response protein AidB-like acyl-CoA dehydrogenase
VIDFALDPELGLLRETARQFAAERIAPREREFESARGPDAEVRRAFAEIGLATVDWPASLDGAELGALGRALVLEELGAADAGSALALDPLGPAFYAIAACGEDAALQSLAKPLLARDGARAVLVWNGARGVELRSGQAHGVVPWVPADRADLVVLLDADSVAVVEAGVALAPLRGAGLRSAGAGELRLDRAPVVASWIDPPGARRALGHARLYAASLLVGVMRAASDYARRYALQRVAFGRPIAHHQALAFLIADLATAVEGARLLVHDAALRLDRGDGANGRCAAAFVEAIEQSTFVTPNAVQILGGHGFMQDYPVEKWMRDARALGLWLGGADAARDDAGAAAIASDAPLALVEAAS